ncbi:triose-phosphate isomerase [Pelagivirga sediminicola]|uniref:Triosephosphate isomerase n=1 Tax=Pelagivirga sediminicola TaxID=2170575 RepID=A0A2T7GB20_9RHOB|nr:triose-phosphate isomerase [Pelagivirga sediminicola]PVA11612.1 triose-phosphate isomerase [Pelagivirga sediminicola]
MRRKLAAGNWKMNGTRADLAELEALCTAHDGADVDLLICPPFTLITAAAQLCDGHDMRIGGQDCHMAASGAHTGDISAEMLKDAGASAVILGHSERRADHAETSDIVRAKARAAHDAGLLAIICVGESLSKREAQNTLDIIGGQLSSSIPDSATGENTVVAYEPCWAIGTGLTPTPDQIGDVHDFIRTRLEKRFGAGIGRSVRLLYGGSVKAGNAAEIFAVSNVDGALVGGASLKADDFSPIIKALEAEAHAS